MQEQVTPLAPASHRINVDEEGPLAIEKKKQRRRRCIKCCGCAAAALLIPAVIITILALTVFRVKDPTMNLNSVTVDGWSQVIWTDLRPGMNLTLTADISVKNSNAASFKYRNATTTISYDGRVIGEAKSPPGNARARRTVRLNVTIDTMVDRIVGIQRLGSDLIAGGLPVSSYTRIGGRVSILKIIKKGVVVRMNCTMTLNITSQGIQDLNCKRKVSL